MAKKVDDDSFALEEKVNITFDEITTLIEHFDGKTDVQKWTRRLDECFELLNLTPLKKFIIAKKLLIGSARRFLDTKPEILDYELLKDTLIQEYKDDVFQKDIFKSLGAERLRDDETRLDLAFRMKIIADRYNIEEKSVVELIIEALPESATQKQGLYSAKNFEELKINLKVFERIFPRTVPVVEPSKPVFVSPRVPFQGPAVTKCRPFQSFQRPPLSRYQRPQYVGAPWNRSAPARPSPHPWSRGPRFVPSRFPALPWQPSQPPAASREIGHPGPTSRAQR